MSVIVTKIANDVVLCPATLLEIINNDPNINAICEVITVNDGINVDLTFSAALTPLEDDAVNSILDAWDNSQCNTQTDPSGNELTSGLSIENDSQPLVGDVDKINFVGSVAARTPGPGEADVYVGYIEVKNADTIPLAKSDPVHIVGTDATTGEVNVIKADAADPSKMPALGVLSSDLAIGESGLAINVGELKNIDTSIYTEGDELWVAATGGMSNSKPTGSNVAIQKIAQVLKSDANSGSIMVFGAGRSNDIPNIPQGKVWMGDANDVPVPTDVYTEIEVDTLIQNTIDTGFGRVMSYGEIPAIQGTTRIPYDNTTPKISEGTEVFSSTVTPSATTKKIKIHINMMVAVKSKKAIFAVFRDSVCIGSTMLEDEGDDDPFTVSLLLIDSPATTSPVTYSLRVGSSSSGGKWYINRIKYNKLNGTISKNGYVIEEFE